MLMFRPLIRYAVFAGRARRAEYWLFVVFQGLVVGGCFGAAFGSLGNPDPVAAAKAFMTWISVGGLLGLALILPHYAVLARRLHDIDKSAWWMLLLAPGFVTPFLISGSLVGAALGAGTDPTAAAADIVAAVMGSVLFVILSGVCNMILFVMTLLPGTRGENRFGPDPRDPHGTDGGGRGSVYDDDRLDELFAQARRERAGDHKPVFDFGPGPSQAQPQTASMAAEPAAAPSVDWGRPAWDPGVAPARPFGRRGA